MDVLIDEFVKKINSSNVEPLATREIPKFLRVGSQDDYGEYLWKIKQQDCIVRIELLQSKLPKPLPKSYTSLISRYAFPAFETASIMLFANTGEKVYHELSESIFKDKFISEFLLKNNLIQIGNPYIGNYDPICFDCRKKVKNNEYPIVQIDHEMILCKEKLKIKNKTAPSFLEFVKKTIDNF